MKRLQLIALGCIIITTLACKEEGKTNTNQSEGSQRSEKTFSLVKDATSVKFTAYKTTNKVAVGGEFKSVNITNITDGNTLLEALNGAKFSIPVSSLFTNDITNTRDAKILQYFFNIMDNTEFISGTFKVSKDNQCSIDITLNGITENLSLEYNISNNTQLSFDGVMHLEKWSALDAVASLNKACEALHTGADGVSKTWSEVAVHADIVLQRN